MSKVRLPEMQEFGVFLRSLRRRSGLSQRKVSERSGGIISKGYLCHVENGYIYDPGVRILRKLSEIYDVPYGDIMKKAGYAPPGYDPIIRDSVLGIITENEEKELLKYLSFLRYDERIKG